MRRCGDGRLKSSISRFQANLCRDDLRSLANLITQSTSIRLLGHRIGLFFSTTPNQKELRDQEQEEKEEEEAEAEEGRVLQLYKSRGQHILRNTRVLDSIVHNAGVLPTDTVLEIGPGTGNLTLKLLRSASSVVAVEIDPRMVDVVRRRAVRSGLAQRLTVIQDDVLKMRLPQFDLCVSNIPYNISSPLLAKLFFGPDKCCFRSTSLLLQKEFAQRLLAEPGNPEFNRLAVNVKLVATVEHILDVSKRDFVPNPKVDSSLVKIYPRATIPQVDLEEWWAFTKLCFGKKNKTLGAIFRQKKKIVELSSRLKKDDKCYGDSVISRMNAADEGEEMKDMRMGLFKERIIQILKSNGFEDKRPSKLSQDELLHLLSLFNQDGLHFHK